METTTVLAVADEITDVAVELDELSFAGSEEDSAWIEELLAPFVQRLVGLAERLRTV